MCVEHLVPTVAYRTWDWGSNSASKSNYLQRHDVLDGRGDQRRLTLHTEGIIYGIPFTAEQVLAYDPKTKTSTLVGEKLQGQQKWASCVMGLRDAIATTTMRNKGVYIYTADAPHKQGTIFFLFMLVKPCFQCLREPATALPWACLAQRCHCYINATSEGDIARIRFANSPQTLSVFFGRCAYANPPLGTLSRYTGPNVRWSLWLGAARPASFGATRPSLASGLA